MFVVVMLAVVMLVMMMFVVTAVLAVVLVVMVVCHISKFVIFAAKIAQRRCNSVAKTRKAGEKFCFSPANS
jgi:hypothetical protein